MIQNYELYYEKIKIPRKSLVNLSTEAKIRYLSELYSKHIQTFVYSNAKLREISLQHPLQRELLDIGTYTETLASGNGYCFQSAQLFYVILKDLGFDVYRCLARVLNGLSVNDQALLSLPATHMILSVNLGAECFLLDPGLGARSHRLPIRMTGDMTVHRQEGEAYRFYSVEGVFVLERLQADKWVQLIQTDLNTIDDQKVRFALLRLGRFPNNIPIRDNRTVFGVVTAQGSKSLFWDGTAKGELIYSSDNRGDYKKVTLSDFNSAAMQLKAEFGVEQTENNLKTLCTLKQSQGPRRRWSVSALHEGELKAMKNNLQSRDEHESNNVLPRSLSLE